MKVLHVNAGLENGGGLSHIVNLLTEAKNKGKDFELKDGLSDEARENLGRAFKDFEKFNLYNIEDY